ncbi:MAG: AraC family transcriptional regulator, partial [Proteobacteria bacterium]
MSGNRSLLCELILKHADQEGLNATSIPGVRCLKFTKATPSVKGEWARSFVIVAQGQKEIELVENVYRYGQAHYIAAPLDLPVVSRVRKASPTEPYLALLLSFDPLELSEVSSQMPLTQETDSNLDSYGLFSGKVSDDMLEAAVRLAKLLSKP